MTIVGRDKLNHPSLGTVGGATLYTAIENIFTKISDDTPGRFVTFTSVANSGVVTVDHNFGVDVGDISKYIYTGTFPALTRVVNPTASGWSVAPTTGFLKTKIDITVPSTGGPFSGVVFLTHGHQAEYLSDLLDVNLTTPPQDGQALVYDSVTSKFKPGASGDSSFKIQTVTSPNLSLKGGYLYLTQDQRELATYDGSGSLSSDFGVDLVLNLTTILGSAPVDATAYYLYVDASSLPTSSTTQTDTGRVVYPVVEANFFLSLNSPEAIDTARFIPIGTVKSATTGTAWSGSGAGFSTEAKFRVQTGLGIGDRDVYNWVSNPRALVGVRGWNGYDDASQIPVDGVGGTPTVTLTRNTTSPLSGKADFKFHKPATDCLGQGFAGDVVVPKGWQVGRQCEHTVLIDTTDTNYFLGDLSIYVYDMTNNVLIRPSVVMVPKMRGPWKISWDSNPGVSNYRLLYHISGSTVAAWDVYFDEVVMGPGASSGNAKPRSQTYNEAAFLSADISTTSSSFGVSWARDGEYMDLHYALGFGTVVAWNASTFLQVKLPGNYTADTSLAGPSSTPAVGNFSFLDSSAGYLMYTGTADQSYLDPQYLMLFVSGQTSHLNDSSNPRPNLGDAIYISARVLIKEWRGQTDNLTVTASPEYYYSPGTWDADTSTTAVGPQGGVITGALTTLRNKTITLTSEAQPNERFKLQFGTDQQSFLDVGDTLNSQRTTRLLAVPGGFAGASIVVQSPTTLIIQFGNFIDYDFNAAAGSAWTSGYWRVLRESGANAVGVNHVTQSLSGLVESAGQLLATNTNDLADVGYVGEQREVIFYTVSNANDQGANLTAGASIVLTAGDYFITGTSLYAGGGSISGLALMVTDLSSTAAYTRISGAFFSDAVLLNEFAFVHGPAGSSFQVSTQVQRIRIAEGQTKTYACQSYCTGGSGSNTVIYTSIRAFRPR